MEKIRILLVDDHTLVRSGIRSLLEKEPGFTVIGEAEDGRTAVSQACQLTPDVVIMDIAMPLLNGLEAARQIKQQCPQVRVLMLSMHDNEEYVRQALEAGAMGYILKDAMVSELVGAVRGLRNRRGEVGNRGARTGGDDAGRRAAADPERERRADYRPGKPEEIRRAVAGQSAGRQVLVAARAMPQADSLS